MAAREHKLSILDQAHAHRLAGDAAAALRMGLACAQAAPDSPGPATLLARVLVDAEKTLIGPEVATRLVDAYVRRGDLANAVVASQLSLDAGADHKPLLAAIAKAFGAGSARIGNAHAVPPPFPQVPMPPALARMTEPQLFDAAETQLTQYLASDDAVPADSKLPLLPLFGALEPTSLETLLGVIRVDDASADTEVVRQDDEGREAFVVARGILNVVRKQGADETVLAALGPGAIFGEMALVSASPRTAAVVAMEPAQILVLARDDLERIAGTAPELGRALAQFCRARMESNLTRHARALAGVAPKERAALLAEFSSRMFEPGETLLARGTEASSVYLIASGSVAVSVPEGGDELLLATLGPGDVVGEISLILRRPTNADVRAVHPTVVYELSREKLHSVMRSYPLLLVELYELATRREEETKAATDGTGEVMSADDVVLM